MTDIEEQWIVTWFPPEVFERVYKTASEAKARSKAGSAEVREWHPMLEHRTIETTTRTVPL